MEMSFRTPAEFTVGRRATEDVVIEMTKLQDAEFLFSARV